MTRSSASGLLALALLAAASYPAVERVTRSWGNRHQLDHLKAVSEPGKTAHPIGYTASGSVAAAVPVRANPAIEVSADQAEYSPDPALLVRVAELGPLLAGWETIGGCGAGSGTGAGAGVKWIGRGVSGGLFNVQSQATYTRIWSSGKLEQHTFFTTLVTRDLSQKWVLGVNVPFVYKYLSNYFTPNPFDPSSAVAVSNGGLGDVSVQLTRKLGQINATSLTALVGVPTGTYDGEYKGMRLLQQQQLGFGKVTGTLILDHTMDEIWGVIVVGGLGSWRGGQNKFDSYRAPNATAYAYSGYFLGPFVPSIGLAATAFKGHDRDQTLDQMTGLYSFAANVSVEWSTDWIAVLAGASLPYQYDGFKMNVNGAPRSPWGRGPLMLALGVALSPF